MGVFAFFFSSGAPAVHTLRHNTESDESRSACPSLLSRIFGIGLRVSGQLLLAQDRIPPPPVQYIPGTGAVIARVYIMYEAGSGWKLDTRGLP